METEKVCVNLPAAELGKIDVLVAEGLFASRTDLIRAGVRLSLFVVGVLRIQPSVTPELADATVERIRIFGAVRGPAAVLARLEPRIVRGAENLEGWG